MTRVAVILSGSGVFDGAEIHESTAALLALARAGAEVTVAAPDRAQLHVVDHQAGEPAEGEVRNVLTESARIARGPVADVAQLDPADFDAVVLPGGFGVAKNLCTFAVDGPSCSIDAGVEAFLRGMHAAGKVIGAACIAPALIARVFGGSTAVKITIGNDPGTAAAIVEMGAEHIEASVTDVVVDEVNRVVSNPAYMLPASITEVFDGVTAMVEKVLDLAASPK